MTLLLVVNTSSYVPSSLHLDPLDEGRKVNLVEDEVELWSSLGERNKLS